MNPLAKMLLKRLSRAARPYLQSYGLLNTSGVYNRSALVFTPAAERVAVLAPHMDDETLGCGGTLALHAQCGARIDVVFLTDGRLGAEGIAALGGVARDAAQRELIERRRREARAALDVLGVTTMHCLDAEDGALASSPDAAVRLRAILMEVRPELVYVPFWLEEHTDHRAASRVLLDAVADTPLDFRCAGYEVWTPLFPNALVDITSVVPQKKAALAAYASQLAQGDYLHTCIGLNAHRAAGLYAPHGRYAEAFCMLSIGDYRKAFVAYCSDALAPH